MPDARRFAPAVSSPPVVSGRQYILDGQSMYVTRDGDRVAPPRGAIDGDEWLHLGTLDGEPCFTRAASAPLDAGEAVHLRHLFGTLDEDDFSIASLALGVLGWDRDHRHCGRCGATTVRSATERARACTACQHVVYPRIGSSNVILVKRATISRSTS